MNRRGAISVMALLIIIVILFFVLSYYGVDFQKTVNTPTTQKNISFVTELGTKFWNFIYDKSQEFVYWITH